MKKSNITCFTLVLFAALQAASGKSFAQTPATTTPDQSTVASTPASTTATTPVITPVTTPATTPEKRVDAQVSPDELFKNGISVRFTQDILQVTGSVPTACAGYLSVRDAKTEAKGDDGSSDDIAKQDDIAGHASHVGLLLSFSASSDMKTLSSCIDGHKGDLDKTDLSASTSMQKIIPNASKDLLLGGFIDSSNAVVLDKKPAMSGSYQTLFDSLDPKRIAAEEKKHCASCNVKELEGMMNLSISGLDVLIDSTLQAEIASEDDVIASAKNVKDLDKARKDLETYADFISTMTSDKDKKEADAALIAQRYETLLTKANDLAFDHQKDASSYADFIASTYGSEANLPGVSHDSREEALQLKSDFASGGSKRIDFLSSVDPTNKEVKAVLDGGRSSLNRQAREVNRACMVIASESALARCNTARQDYQTTQLELSTISQRYQYVQQMQMMARYSQNQPMYGNQFNGGFSAGGSMNGLPNSVFTQYSNQNVNGGLYMNNPNSANMLYGMNSGQNNLAFNGNANFNSLYQVNSNPLTMNGSAGSNLYNNRAPSTLSPTAAIPINLNYSVNQLPNQQVQQQQQGPFMPTFSFADSTANVSGS